MTEFIISDLELDIELLANIKNRSIEQKQLYRKDGTLKYYKSTAEIIPRAHTSIGFTNEEYYDFLYRNYLKNKNNKYSIISLACGNCTKEKYILEQMIKDKFDFIFTGIDSSKNMIIEAENKLEKINDKNFICTDFSSKSLKNKITDFIKEYDQKIYFLLGSTIGNTFLEVIAKNLSNLINNGDMFLLDLITRNNESNEKIFEKYSSYINIPEIASFYFNPLERIGVPFQNGEIILKMYEEENSGALRAEFAFIFKKQTSISFLEEIIKIEPNEKIILNNIRIYNPKILLQVFSKYDFEKLDYIEKNNKLMLILKKI